MPQVVVVHAVDLPVDLVGPSSIQGAVAARRVAAIPRCGSDQLREVSAIQGHDRQITASDGGCLRLGRSIQSQRRRRNFHGGGLLRERQLHWQRVNGALRYQYVIDGQCRESCCGHGYRVHPNGNILEGKLPVSRCEGRVINPRGLFFGLNLGIRHDCARRIHHRPVNRATKRLRVCCKHQRQHSKNC